MKLITISGLDGSGKSTQIEMLKNYFESQNKKVFYFHAIEFGIAKKIVDFRNKYCLICKLTGKCRTKKSNSEKSVTHANFLQIFARKFCLMTDIMRFKLLYGKLIKNNYDFVVSDRYFYDSIINIYYLRKSSNKIPCEKIVRKPDLAIYLQTDPDAIMKRDRKPDQGIEYLKTKKEFYDNKYSEWNMKLINGTQEKENILENIKIIIS